MRVRHFPIALLALPALTAAIALTDFPPAIPHLPPSCDHIYRQTISGCSATDFGSGGSCSVSCVQALDSMTDPIKAACGNYGLSGENIIVAFLANSGPESICGNANAVLASAGASSSAASSAAPSTTAAPSTSAASSTPATTSTTPQSSSTDSSTAADSSTSTASSSVTAEATSSTSTSRSSGTSTASASTSSSGTSTTSGTSSTTAAPTSTATSSSTSSAMSVDTSSPPSPTTPDSSTATSASSANAQTNYNDHSGGGSPFDSAGNMSNAASGRVTVAAFGYAVGTSFAAACAVVLMR